MTHPSATLNGSGDESPAKCDRAHGVRVESLDHERSVRVEAQTLNDIARDLASELDLQKLLQKVTDAGTLLTRAAFGAFFYNAYNEQGEAYLLYTLSGAPREAFEKFGFPRATPLFGPTFRGETVIRLEDVQADPRYGKMGPSHGMPVGHLPVRSYLAVPVKSRGGEVLGGLFFGHPSVGVFTEHDERVTVGLAGQAAVAIDNARLFSQLNLQLDARAKIEASLQLSQQSVTESELLHRQLLQHLPEAVYTCDNHGRITLFNDAAVRLWGRIPIIGEDLWCGSWKIFKTDGTPMPLEDCPMAATLRSGKSVIGEEIVIERPDGTRRNVLLHPQPIFDSRGQVIGAVNMLVDITDRKEAMNSQSLLSSIVESSDDAILSISLDGRITSWNEGATGMYGYSELEAVGEHVSMLIPEERRTSDTNLLEQLRRGERIDHFETIRVTKSGERIDVSLTVSPVLDSTGRIIGASKIARDITQRKQVRQALRDIQERFARFMQHLPGLAWIKDDSGRYVYANDAAEQAFNVPRGRLYGKRDEDIFEPSTAAMFRTNDRKAFESGESIEVIESLRQTDGVHHSLVTKFSIPGADSSPTLVGGMAIDITDRIRMEDELRQSEQRFRLIADEAPVLIWMNDTAGCEFVNREYLEFTGCSIDELRGMKWAARLHPEDAAGYLHDYARAMELRTPFTSSTRFRRGNGEYRWLQSNGMPRLTQDGRLLGYVGCSVDITDQINARDALQLQQSLLEDAVVARTAQLEESNRRLRIAERMASLGTLSAGLGHDMGNLLVPLRVRLQSLAGSSLTPQQKEDVDAIGTAAEYLQRLSSGLRMLATDPQRDRLREQTEIRSWWSDASILCKNAVPRTVRIASRLPDHPCHVRISRAALTQVVFNLVQNAGEALKPRGTGTITVSVTPVGDRVKVEIADDGPGMSESVRMHCMEPFFTTKPRGISTGLGLVLVYGLIRDASGSVSVNSIEGEGTTFTLILPAAPDDSAANRSTMTKHAFVQLNDRRLGAFISAELTQLGYHVTSDEAQLAQSEVVIASDVRAGTPMHPSARVLLVGASPGSAGVSNATILEGKPSPQEIRNAIRSLAGLHSNAGMQN